MSSQMGINEGKISYVEVLKKMKYDLKQNIISCGFVKSLKDIALMQIAIRLWQHGIRDDVKHYLYSLKTSKIGFSLGDFLDKFNNEVILMTTKLMIPHHLQKRLKLMVTMIREEIGIFFSYFRFLSLRSWIYIEKIIIYWDNLCLTREGKINMIKTVESIVEDSRISTSDKYILACNNCLKGKIPDLLEKIPDSFITEMLEKDVEEEVDEEVADEHSNNFKQFRLVLFWTFHFRGENERFGKLINGTSTYEYLIKWTIYNQQEPALQYFWENFADEEMKQNVVEFIEFCHDLENITVRQNYLLYLFNQIIDLKFNDLMSVKISDCLIETLNRISKYYNIDLVPQYVFDFINANDYFDVIHLVSECWYRRFVDIKSYVRIWEMFELRFNYNTNEYLDYAFNIIAMSLKYKSTVDWFPVRLLIKKRTLQQKVYILLEEDGMNFCLTFIDDELDAFELFLKDVFDSEEEISYFKSKIFTTSRFDEFCLDLASENNFKCLEDILIKFCPEELLSNYKNNIPYKDDAYVIKKMLTDCIDVDLLTSLDKLISWCYEENEVEINKCKSKLFDPETDLYMTNKERFFDRIERQIKWNQWELVESYWKWIFFATEEKIMTRAKKLIRIKEILYFGSRQKFCEFLMRFITSCFAQDEIDELREELKNNDILFTFVKDMLELEEAKYSKIDDLLDWCYSTNKNEVDKFKKKFISIYKIKLSKDNSNDNGSKRRNIEEASQSEI